VVEEPVVVDEPVVAEEPVIVEEGNQSPVADAGSDFTAEIEEGRSTDVTLDGSGSFDPDSPVGYITSYQWKIAGTVVGAGQTPTIELEKGIHTVILTVVDNEGAADSRDVIVTVTDNGKSGGGHGNDKPCNSKSRKCVSEY
ncbi:MAG: hypothetical protein IID53_03230, partial [Proteobacteria bacterium]|nr:hypothetical protein [Pseudomonadota bacterium]